MIVLNCEAIGEEIHQMEEGRKRYAPSPRQARQGQVSRERHTKPQTTQRLVKILPVRAPMISPARPRIPALTTKRGSLAGKLWDCHELCPGGSDRLISRSFLLGVRFSNLTSGDGGVCMYEVKGTTGYHPDDPERKDRQSYDRTCLVSRLCRNTRPLKPQSALIRPPGTADQTSLFSVMAEAWAPLFSR